ncbi:hypothetical protein X975_18230, partial [Stegodyphus mimosarum]
MLEKYIQGASKAVSNINTGKESRIYVYEHKIKQRSTLWVFQDEPNLTKVVCGRSTLEQMVTCSFGITGHVVTVALEQCRTVNSKWCASNLLARSHRRNLKKAEEENHSSS